MLPDDGNAALAPFYKPGVKMTQRTLKTSRMSQICIVIIGRLIDGNINTAVDIKWFADGFYA